MHFNKIIDENLILPSGEYSIDDIKVLANAFEDDILYKVELYKVSDIIYVNNFTIGNEYCFPVLSGQTYPESAMFIDLKKGDYAILHISGGIKSISSNIINDSIKTTISNLNFNFNFNDLSVDSTISSEIELNDLLSSQYYNIDKALKFKLFGKSKFFIWIDEQPKNVIGHLNFSIYKILKERQNIEPEFTAVINKDYNDNIKVKNGQYRLIVSELVQKEEKPIKPKYPQGTYQIVINSIIETGKLSNDVINEYKNMNGTVQLIDMNDIPEDADPLNRYIMLGKIEMNLYIDYSNDRYYLYPTTYAECFMNLFVPKKEMTLITDNDDFALYHIIDYELIAYDFKNSDQIKRNLKRWLDCTDDDINTDEYQLYYYIRNFKLYHSHYEKFKKYIDENFIYVKLENIIVKATDNLSSDFSNEPLDYTLISCDWRILQNQYDDYNRINWSEDRNWISNNDDIDEIEVKVYGDGVIKLSKKHFKNILNEDIDLDSTTSGILTSDEKFKSLELNDPMIFQHERFQYWTGIVL